MLIDWTTVIFQLVNFLILMALLKKFLFGRVTKAMDEREEEIAGRLERAAEKQNQADRLKDEYERKAAHIEQERRERLETAGREAEEKRKELIRQAREEVDLQKKRWRQSLDDERDSFLRRMRDLAATQVFEISRRVLADLADAELDERAAKVFTRRLSELSEEDRVAVADGLKKADGRALVRSGFDLSPALKAKITGAVHQRLGREIDVDYESDPDLILGLVLRSEGRKLAWSAVDYLDDLEAKGREAFGPAVEEKSGVEETEGGDA